MQRLQGEALSLETMRINCVSAYQARGYDNIFILNSFSENTIRGKPNRKNSFAFEFPRIITLSSGPGLASRPT